MSLKNRDIFLYLYIYLIKNMEENELKSINELLKEQLEAVRQNTDELREQLSIASRITQNANLTKSSINKINSLNRQLVELNRQLVSNEDDRNELLREKKDILKDIQKSLILERSIQTEIEEIIENQSMASTLGAKKLQNVLDGLKSQLNFNEDIANSLKLELELNDRVNKSLGITGALAESLKKSLNKFGLGKLTDQLGIDDAIEKTKIFTSNLVNSQIQSGKKGGLLVNNLKSASKLVTSLGKNLLKSLGPIYLVIELVDSLLELDTRTENIAKSLGKSYSESIGLVQNINNISTSSDNIYITSEKLTEAFITLNEMLGTNVMLSERMLINFTEFTNQIGYSTETAKTLSQLALATNKDSSELAKIFLGQTKILNIKNDLSLNEKQILEDISEISGGLLVTFSKQPQELAKSVFESRRLGLNLRDVERLSNNLLNIENSIAKEFEAEVLTGRMLNLERARYYALTNDISGVAKEINNQGITAVEFSRMNRIQQEAIAEAVGLSRDEMGKSLIEQEAIRNVGASNLDDLKSKLKIAQEQGKEEEFLLRLGNEQYAAQLKSNSAQTQFKQTIDKLKDVFVQLVDPLLPVLEVFGNILSVVGKIIQKLDPVLKAISVITGGIGDILSWDFKFTGLQKNWGEMQKSTTENWGLDTFKYKRDEFGNTKTRIQDGVIDSKGDIKVSTPKGQIQLDDEDTFVGNKNGIIAGTNLGGNEGNITQLTNSLGNKLDILVQEMKEMKQELKRGMIINLDGNRISNNLIQPLSMNIRNT